MLFTVLRSIVWQPSRPVGDPTRSRKVGVCSGVRLGGVPRFMLHARTKPCRNLGDGVDNAATNAATAGAHSDHHCRFMSTPDDHVLGAGRAVEVVPRPQRSLLTLNYQRACTGEDEESLLRLLAVVHPKYLAWLKHVDVDPELWEATLALERAVHAQRAFIAPPRLTRVQDKPAIHVRDESVPRHPQRSFGHHGRSLATARPTRKASSALPGISYARRSSQMGTSNLATRSSTVSRFRVTAERPAETITAAGIGTAQ